MRRAVVVKLGSSTLVDGRRRLRRARLSRLASELVALQLTGTPVCVVSSGAIALGLGALERDVRPTDVPGLQARDVARPHVALERTQAERDGTARHHADGRARQL